MNDQNLTQWFPSCVKPARSGVYMVMGDAAECALFQHWNGHWWGFREPSASKAYMYRDSVSSFQTTKWRGLAKEPK